MPVHYVLELSHLLYHGVLSLLWLPGCVQALALCLVSGLMEIVYYAGVV